MLGGQHISAAVRALYEKRTRDQGLEEQDLQLPQTHVMAEVLRADTPMSVAQIAAGQHQRHQTNVKCINSFDIMSMMATESEKKLKSAGTAFLDDSELFVTLDKMGVVNEGKMEPGKEKGKGKMKPADALVCMLK